jgi:hypothetical protein
MLHTIFEDVADNIFNPDPYYQQGGDMVRIGGLGYRIDIAQAAGQPDHRHDAAEPPASRSTRTKATSWPAGPASTKAPRARRSGTSWRTISANRARSRWSPTIPSTWWAAEAAPRKRRKEDMMSDDQEFLLLPPQVSRRGRGGHGRPCDGQTGACAGGARSADHRVAALAAVSRRWRGCAALRHAVAVRGACGAPQRALADGRQRQLGQLHAAARDGRDHHAQRSVRSSGTMAASPNRSRASIG